MESYRTVRTVKVIVIFESTRGRTKAMAEAICEGVTSKGKICEVRDAKDVDSVGDACALAVGSSTRMKRPLPKVKQLLSEMSPLEGVPTAAFGSFGWSGEAPDEIAKMLEEKGGRLVAAPLKVKDYPSADQLEACKDLGVNLATSCD
ncbi:MAG: flavodoxin domain-containing protein [Candidatus Thorarchaeota archaeon]